MGGVCLSACWDRPPGCGPRDHPSQIALNFPLRYGPGDPLARSPSTSPLGVAWRPHTPWLDPPQFPPPLLVVGLETCKACWDTTPLGDLLQGMLAYNLQCMLGYHPPLWTVHCDRSYLMWLYSYFLEDVIARGGRSLLVVYFGFTSQLCVRVVPHGTKGTGPMVRHETSVFEIP